MKIAVPVAALGSRGVVSKAMRRWVRAPSVPAVMASMPVAELAFVRTGIMIDVEGRTSVRLNLFENAWDGTRPGDIMQAILDANGDPWWAPFLVENINVPALAPVIPRLLAISRRTWRSVVEKGLYWEFGYRTEQLGRTFNGLLEPGEPESWLTEPLVDI